MARRGGLGRGLDSLIPPGADDEGAVFRDIPVSSITANRRQPRTRFDEEAMAALTASVRELGVLQPVLVRSSGPGPGGPYELIAGERRWRAARRAGLATIPAIVRTVDDTASLEQAIVENVQREDLNPMDEAAAYQQLIEDFHLTHDELATRVGKSRAAISNTLRLFQLPPAVQRMLHDGQLTAGHARALLTTPDRTFQEGLAQRAVRDGLSVRTVEDLARHHNDGNRGEDRAAAPEPGPAPKQAPGGGLRPAGLLELEDMLASHLDTRVKVELGASKGRVVVEFADLEDLERIYRAMTGK
ncbi:MAG: ParB/RepB/Spo0J family partition protein [Actinomycetota bacterium]